MSPRNFAFIDAWNLYMGIKSLGWSIEVSRFRVYVDPFPDDDAAYEKY